MLAFVIQINAFLIAGLVLTSGIIGFWIRSSQLAAAQNKLVDLEKEILDSHAEILQLQRDKIDLIKGLSQPQIPVIPMNTAKEEKTAEAISDSVARKKLLATSPGAVK